MWYIRIWIFYFRRIVQFYIALLLFIVAFFHNILGDIVKKIKHYELISLLLSFILYWILGRFMVVFTMILVTLTLYVMKKRNYVINNSLIWYLLYLILGIFSLFFHFISLNLLVIILGNWFSLSYFFNKKL